MSNVQPECTYGQNGTRLTSSGVIAGLETVDYPSDIRQVKESVVRETLDILEKAGVVKAPSEGWELQTFVDTQVASVV